MWRFFLCRANRCLPFGESCILKSSHTFFCENFVKKSFYDIVAEIVFQITQAAEKSMSSLDPRKHAALDKLEVKRSNPSALQKATQWPYDKRVFFTMTKHCIVSPFRKLFIRDILAFFSFLLTVLSLHSQPRVIPDPTVWMLVFTSDLHLTGELVHCTAYRLAVV